MSASSVPHLRSLVFALLILFISVGGWRSAASADLGAEAGPPAPKQTGERVETVAERVRERIEAERTDVLELTERLHAATTTEDAERLVLEIEGRKLLARIETLGIQFDSAQIIGHEATAKSIAERVKQLEARRSQLLARSVPDGTRDPTQSAHQ